MSKKYVPGFLEVERIQKEARRIGEELGRKAGLIEGKKEGFKEGAKDKAIEMAKMLKENGVDISLIAKSSGLSKAEIERL